MNSYCDFRLYPPYTLKNKEYSVIWKADVLMATFEKASQGTLQTFTGSGPSRYNSWLL